MNNLYFMIGLPRSGKSTMAQQWLNHHINILNSGNAVLSKSEYVTPRAVVCADDIRLSMGHRWNSYVEDYVHATKITMIRTLLRKHDVLVDETHTTENSIRQLLQIHPRAKALIMSTTPDVCKARAKLTNQEDLYPVIDRMAEQLYKLSNSVTFQQTEIIKTIDKLRDQVTVFRIND